MIHVDRTKVDKPAALVGETSLAGRELARAIKHFEPEDNNGGNPGSKPNGKKKFNFRVYKDDKVKEALHTLFQGKCAYCESRYAATQPMDVEHFRPKSEATDFDGTAGPGYYWLAADWDNLLPSCIDCNRARRHKVQPGNEVKLLGKETLFPIAKGAKRITRGQEISVEKSLLLDPCRDDPEQYLSFVEGIARLRNDNPETIRTLERITGIEPAERVNASIEVYGLNRTELVQDRQTLVLRLKRRMFTIRRISELLKEFAEPPTSSRKRRITLILEELLSREIEELLASRDARMPYAALARQMIREFRAEFTIPKETAA